MREYLEKYLEMGKGRQMMKAGVWGESTGAAAEEED